MKVSSFLRVIGLFSFLVIGSLALAQATDSNDYVDELPPMDGLSTQADGATAGDGFNASAGTCSGLQCNYINVVRILTYATGWTYIATSGIEGNLSCNALGNAYIRVHTSHAAHDEIFAQAMFAQANNTKLTFGLYSGNYCQINYVYDY